MAPPFSRSPQMPPSPPVPAPASRSDESQFPQGQCRYILTLPELKGLRCACVGFDRNKTLPGATCDCGHLACFHLSSVDAPSPGKNRDEIETLKQRVHVLERQGSSINDCGDLSQVLPRLSQLEENLDKNREELQNEVKGTYQNISAAWQTIEQLQKRLASFEKSHRIQSEQLMRAGKELADLRNRNLELLETDEMLEERIEKLEGLDTQSIAVEEAPSLTQSPAVAPMNGAHRRRSSVFRPIPLPAIQDSHKPACPDVAQSGAWTVHVSFLPSKEQPFPFEKDTIAYKRCLSRGLQRMIAVEGTDSASFDAAVSKAFGNVLGGCAWEPLRAKICDARELEGLPMLRSLGLTFSSQDYNVDFLREHCAVCGANGRIQALYVALRHGVLSWNRIKSLPVYVEGLESCWAYDKYLDEKESDDTEPAEAVAHNETVRQPSVPSDLPTLKRGASEMQATSLATGGTLLDDSEGARVKKSQKCMPEMIKIR